MSEQAFIATASDFVFETSQLRCRLLSNKDQTLYLSLYSTDEIMRFITEPLTETAAERSFQFALRCAEQRPLRRLFLVVESKNKGVALGVVGISSLDWQQQSVEYGLMLTKTGQGKGYAPEVTKACLAHLTQTIGMKRVWVDISEQNKAALKVARMVGFTPSRLDKRIYEYSSI
ncbi:GNAT family N-acetyltransferase [Alkalimonas collagenimarina]|uniref:GNAT family N-acetyltransferase n=1 Tax=Alkalimonas collagenimarina TaxID=400390 RepID=A0ABT9GWP0_9GAMM|nr:GNAT family N-acetyltransferase [Alkalimonas collagenimarina]MDP4535284.1 GNAT family N-acetyltransferase [Alkalimonas collagenimarina]